MIRRGPFVALFAVAWLAGLAPAHGAGAVRFARGGHASIPFDLQRGHVWVRGVVGGSDSLWITVDTGASSAVMDEALAKSLGLKPHGQHETHGAGGAQPSASVSDITIGIGGLSIHLPALDTTDLTALSAQSAHPMHLILGHELFESSIVRFDYARGVMDVWDAAHAPRDAPGAEVPLTFEDNHPYVEGTLGMPGRPPLRGRFILDTGSSAGLILAPDVAARESLAQSFPRTLRVVGRGVGGERLNRVGRAESFALGGLRFDRPLVIVPDPGPGAFSAPGTMGNIGGQLLGRCRVTFDYPRRRVRFEPGAGFGGPFEADMSGISFLRDPSGWIVRLVNPGTPASEAGVREADVVTSVDAIPAARIDARALSRLMQREGQTVRLGIRRGGEASTVTMVLRRLL
jgi:predicted aspartyl protease